MRKLLNTLFVTTQGAYLSKDGDTVTVVVEKETALRLPLHTIEGIVCFGNVGCSPFLMGACGEHNVGLSFLTESGHFLARVQGRVRGNVLLRRQQLRFADDEDRAAEAAQQIVAAKVANSRVLLQRASRERSVSCSDLDEAVTILARILEQLSRPLPVEAVRGLEGEAARCYFGVFNGMIGGDSLGFVFEGRSRRPPLDEVNAMLSFAYTLLVHECESACEAVGLDPAVGFLHADRPGRPGLALDLMEEFRAPLADRLVLALINRRQVKVSGFTKTESGAVLMDEDTRKELIHAWQERKLEEMKHPFLDETVRLGLLPYIQALLLARWIRGDLDAYPAMLWR